MVIFRDEHDYEVFANMLRRVARRCSWELITFCLMPTHYHVLLEASRANLSLGMHHLNGSYAKYFNKRHRRSGALFQGRFHTRVVESERYLERVDAYIGGNPVRAGLCETPDEWPFSWSMDTSDIASAA
jgi:REP element-mobilizing transposase RayT